MAKFYVYKFPKKTEKLLKEAEIDSPIIVDVFRHALGQHLPCDTAKYLLLKVPYRRQKGVIICRVHKTTEFNSAVSVGIALCSHSDAFNENYGKYLAKTRAVNALKPEDIQDELEIEQWMEKVNYKKKGV